MAKAIDISNAQQPLKGVILCCTALPQDVRTNIADVAVQMGAVNKLDLTSDVTHLIVGSITTPKYRYVAKERPDIHVLDRRWIEAVREAWMEGGAVDVAALEEQYHTPPFTGLQICVTGFDNHEQRNYISSTLEEQGATYHGDLTKVVTHLIAATPQGAKYNAARQWGTSIVSLKWFKDSLIRGMALEEGLYDPTIPAQDQGKGAFRQQARSRASLGKREREESQTSVGEDAGRKKLRRSASTRLESQSQDMWTDISTHDAGGKDTAADQWKEEEVEVDMTSHISESSRPTSARRIVSAANIAGPQGLFSGLYVLIVGFDKKRTSLLGQVLQQNGASIVRSNAELEDASQQTFFKGRYLVVPHTVSDLSQRLPEVPASTSVATEWWVERCIHQKRLLDPLDDVLSAPLWNAQVPGFSDLTISTTGFSGVDLRQVAETVKLMGATYQESMLPSSSVVISASADVRKEKAFYASRHNIPVVSADWLWTCLQGRKKVSFESFKISLPAQDPNDFTRERLESGSAKAETSQSRTTQLERKDEQQPKRLSSTRKTQATPSLQMHSAKLDSKIARAKLQSIVHEDDDIHSIEIDVLPKLEPKASSRTDSQPLQERSPNSSPHKSRTCVHNGSNEQAEHPNALTKTSSRTVSPAKPVSPDGRLDKAKVLDKLEDRPAPRLQHQLTADLAEILNRHTSSRPGSAMNVEPPKKRKHRPLGRAPSGTSNRSLSASADRPPSVPQLDGSESAVDGFSVPTEVQLPPSTQLGYETAEAAAHRLHMSKKMGTKLQDEEPGMKRLASVGTVKDSSLMADAGVSNRIRGKHRNK